MADFFVTLQRQETLEGGGSGGLPEWFSTHPSPVDREAAVRTQTAAWRGKLPGQSFRINRDAYFDRIDGLIYGDDPRQGFREGDYFYLVITSYSIHYTKLYEFHCHFVRGRAKDSAARGR